MVINPADIHIGKYAAEKETGDAYNTAFTLVDEEYVTIANSQDNEAATVRFSNAKLTPGQAYSISIQASADPSLSSTRYWVTAIFKWDYSTIPADDEIV